MGKLLIEKIIYKGENYFFESPSMDGGLNIIEGSNGNGKSTLMNLIYYGLSGRVEEFNSGAREAHDEITKDKHNYVSLKVRINENKYTFTRFINSTDITVSTDEGLAKVYPINRSKTEKTIFSDWILSVLEIEPVHVFQGDNNFIINFRNLMRLVYHNQELNPKKIYKPEDADNFIADSEVVRKIIFELLLGKTYSEYYSTLAKFKEKEKERTVAKASLDEFISMAKAMNTNNEDLNLVFLEKSKTEKEEQLQRLYNYREGLKENNKPRVELNTGISDLRSKLIALELQSIEKSRMYNEVADELGKLRKLRDNVILEVTQISKIIHSHETLTLFSADTCPYCLSDVTRKEGHCVCGNEVAEEEYERFFYSSDEYSDILKSKQKSIETIDLAIFSCQSQVTEIQNEFDGIKEKIKENNSKIESWIKDYDFTSNDQELKVADDTILQVRTEINTLVQQVDLEQKRNSLQNAYQKIDSSYQKLKIEKSRLEAEALKDIQSKIESFNIVYNSLMTNTIKDLRSAVISNDDYMPVLDGGIYREASASVAKRFLYYLTLLKLSLDYTDVKFPRLLLIDTPETAGVDFENLKACFEKIETITNDQDHKSYQIILTTGQGKYPEQFKKFVKLTLTDDDKLLKRIEKVEVADSSDDAI